MIRRSAGRVDLVRLNAAMLAVAALLGGSLLLGLEALGRHAATLGPQPLTALGLVAASVVFNFAVGNSAYFQALRRLGVARAMPLTLVQPLLAALLAAGLLGERITPGLAVGVILIPAGVYLVAGPSGKAGQREGIDRLGLALALIAPLAWSLGSVTLRPALAWLDPLTATVLRVGSGAPMIAALSLAGARGRAAWPRPLPALLAGLPFTGSTLLFVVS